MITTYLGFRWGTHRFADFKVSQMIFRRPPVSWLSPVIVKETASTFVVVPSFCHFEKDVWVQAAGLLTNDVCVGVETTPKYGDRVDNRDARTRTHLYNNNMADNFRLSTVVLLNQVSFKSQLCRLVLRGERWIDSKLQVSQVCFGDTYFLDGLFKCGQKKSFVCEFIFMRLSSL